MVTGGAGYIGSHVVKLLGEQGHEITVFDNLSTGHAWAVLYGSLEKGDLGNFDLLHCVIKKFRPDAVIHFAASIQVDESIREPLKYYHNNLGNTLNLLRAMAENEVEYLIYSSTAAVYGIPEKIPISESAPPHPINPYGASKFMAERILKEMSEAGSLKYVALRYFNAAGANKEGNIGQAYKESTHLITRALKTAKGEHDILSIYGTDYPTPDGTCIRDYIHVDDLAQAHSNALAYLMSERRSEVMNCGYGHGYSVREVIKTAQEVTGVNFSVEETDRRPGDPPAIVAESSRLRKLTDWKPKYDDLECIIRTAWNWERRISPTIHNAK